MAKGIRLLDKKKHFWFLQEKIMQVRAFERYIPLNRAVFIVIQYIAVIIVLYKPLWLSCSTVRDFVVIQYIVVIILLYKHLW